MAKDVSFTRASVTKEGYSWKDATFGWKNDLISTTWKSMTYFHGFIGVDCYGLKLFDTALYKHNVFCYEDVVFKDPVIFNYRINKFLSSFLLSDLLCFDVKFKFYSILCLKDLFFLEYAVFYDELVKLNVNVFSNTHFCFDCAEPIVLKDIVYPKIEMFLDSGLLFTSDSYSGFNFIFSNLAFFNRELSFDDLVAFSKRPVGYSNFQNFKVGEYEYKDAIVRLSVNSSNLNYSTALDRIVLHVDIPDTDDRGVASIGSDVTYVKFNKKYYNPPEEVSLSIKGGITGGVLVPKLIDVDDKGFHCCILNSNGSMVEGQISWASKGY